MSRRMQLGLPMAPWYDATCRDCKRRIRWKKQHNQSFAELQQQYTTYCRLRKKQFKKEKADEMVGLIDTRSPKVYKWPMTAIKRTDISPISAESWTEHLQSPLLCNHKRVFLTCYLDDPTYLHVISYSVTSYDLDNFSFWLCSPTRSWWKVQKHEHYLST